MVGGRTHRLGVGLQWVECPGTKCATTSTTHSSSTASLFSRTVRTTPSGVHDAGTSRTETHTTSCHPDPRPVDRRLVPPRRGLPIGSRPKTVAGAPEHLHYPDSVVRPPSGPSSSVPVHALPEETKGTPHPPCPVPPCPFRTSPDCCSGGNPTDLRPRPITGTSLTVDGDTPLATVVGSLGLVPGRRQDPKRNAV